jgi:glycosyltransferase involved in cell wall biosynthesis
VGAVDVCIVSHDAYGELSGQGGRVGGVERQTALLARWLAGRGHRVSMVTWDLGQPDGVEIDGVRVFKVCRESDGVPIVRFAHPRWSSLLQALRRANAAVYYQNVIDGVTGQVALWCRARRRPFVYSASSDSDCDPALPLLDTRRERLLFRAGLRLADRIIVQTARQQSMLRRHFRRDSVVIPLSVPDDGRCVPRHAGRRVAWVGRVCEVKRAERLLDAAERCPEIGFDLVGPGDGSRYAAGIEARARTLANVTVHGPLHRTAVLEQLAGAACLCCTSDIEGFPNTFLEAWSLGVPVVSTFDPDGTIAREGLGWFVGDPARLPAVLRAVTSNDGERHDTGARARAYYTRHHTPDAVMPHVEAVLQSVAAR